MWLALRTTGGGGRDHGTNAPDREVELLAGARESPQLSYSSSIVAASLPSFVLTPLFLSSSSLCWNSPVDLLLTGEGGSCPHTQFPHDCVTAEFKINWNPHIAVFLFCPSDILPSPFTFSFIEGLSHNGCPASGHYSKLGGPTNLRPDESCLPSPPTTFPLGMSMLSETAPILSWFAVPARSTLYPAL